MSKRYNNYHKHTHISTLFATADSNTHAIDYINRCKELCEPNYWTTEHGTSGDVFEANTFCEQNNIHCKAALEGYIVTDPLSKDASNYHIILIPRTNAARKKLNKANSRANKEGFYYRPRLFLEDILAFKKDELYITSACMAGLLSTEDSTENILMPLINRFEDSVFLEVQNHNIEIQKDINRKAIDLANGLGLKLICANDSHYIYPYEREERVELLKGKNINYGDEDVFILDYPDYETMVKRFQEQGILTDSQIEQGMETTLLLDDCEDIRLTREIKMPTIHQDKTDKEKINLLKKEVNIGFEKVIKEDNIPKEKQKKYIQELRREMKVVEATSEIHTVDYFLLNIKMLDLAINKYGGVLTRSGRGSCGSYLTNKMLGITQIDRLTVDLPIYPERFMSTERLLENHALPDIDYNVVSQEPFVKASRELLGETGVYPMIAYGTMKQSEAFRNICRSAGLSYDEYNDVAKNLDNYESSEKWKPYIEQSKKYLGTIISASVHPCAHLLLNKDIEEEVGVVKIGDTICAMITSDEADEYKYLKNDYLIVSVWGIIEQTFNMVGKPIPTIKELVTNLDDKVWSLFSEGYTCTLNQVDSDYATALVKKYRPKTVEELAEFIGAIRPNFNDFRDDFMNRRYFTNGSSDLDKLFRQTQSFIIFQENLMQFFEWLGITPAESIGLIKKISKKKIKKSDFDALTERLEDGWEKQVGSLNSFHRIWEKMQSMMSYGFNTPHGLAYAYDCLYCAYLKANYPLEYFTVTLNMYKDSQIKTERLTDESKNWSIKIKAPKFGYAHNEYMCDKESNTIYKGLGSIKDMRSTSADIMLQIAEHNPKTFLDILYLREEVKVNGKKLDARSLDILIDIGFFSNICTITEAKTTLFWFNKYGTKKTFKKEKLTEPWILEIVEKNAEKETAAKFSQLNNRGIIEDVLKKIPKKEEDITTLIRNQITYLGYADAEGMNISPLEYMVQSVREDKYNRVWMSLHQLATGVIKDYKCDSSWFKKKPCKKGDIIKAVFKPKDKVKFVGQDDKGKNLWQKTGEYENILKYYSFV